MLPDQMYTVESKTGLKKGEIHIANVYFSLARVAYHSAPGHHNFVDQYSGGILKTEKK